MKVFLITNSKIKDSEYLANIKKKCNLIVTDLKKVPTSKNHKEDFAILLSKKIFNRRNNLYKKTISFVTKRKIKMIEVAFQKSEIGKEQACSEAIIHGFEEMTWKIIEKVIKKNRLSNDT